MTARRTADDVRAEVAATARMLAAAGLVEAFGHVSARLPGGAMALTSTRPLAVQAADDILVLDAAGAVVAGPAGDVPLERHLHRAVYDARPDVHAVCRGHGPWTVAWGTGTADVPLRHGLGLLAGTRVRVHDDVLLVRDPAAGVAAARTLGPDVALVLRGNGAFAVGPDPLTAAVRLHALEERARVALLAPAADPVGDGDWQQRSQDTEVELRRACRWFASTCATAGPHAPSAGALAGRATTEDPC